MELRHLRYFVAVAELLNFRKAAEELRVAQPALSSQIQDLEHELGVRLLDRDTGGVRLTDAGAAFLEEARATLRQAQTAMAVAREAAKGRRGRLTVGYLAPLLMGFMPMALKEFHRRHPDVDVALVEVPLTEQLAGLEAGTIQVGFTLDAQGRLPASLQKLPVVRSPIRAVVGRGHPLARHKRISLADIVREPLVCFSLRRGVPSVHGDIMRRSLVARSLRSAPIRAVEGAEAFRATIESGLGVSMIAAMGSLSRSRDLVFRPLKEQGEDLVVTLYAVWPKRQTSQFALNFIEVLRDARLPAGMRAPEPAGKRAR
jgi:DNA-binding transcriptional LysR family regulator